MKKNLILRAALMAALTLGLAVSCAEEPIQTEEPEAPVIGNPSVIQASIPEEITKVSLTPGADEKGLALAWEAGDQLTVIGNTTEQFSIAEGFTANKADFEGTPVEGDSFTVIYPGQTYASAAAVNARTYTEQVQSGNANTDHLEWNAMLEGVADYSSLNFSGAGCRQNGALKFHLQLPEGFSTVEWVSLSAPEAIFSTSNDPASEKVNELKLTLQNVDVSESNRILTAYMMVSWNENAIAAGTELTIKVKGEQDEPWTKVKTVGEEGFTIAGGKVTSLKLNDSDWDEPLFWSGNGTESDPYTIKTVRHLQNVKQVISGQEGLYFKLIEDIDLSSVAWGPLNAETTVKTIHFDGNQHTISNMTVVKSGNTNYNSLFGYISGEVSDLTIENASITSGNNASSSGILAGWFQDGTITNVDIRGTNTVTLANNIGEYTGCGGLVGIATGATVKDCDIEGVTLQISGSVTPQNGGGLAGRIANRACTFENCTFKKGAVTAAYRSGGLIGSAGAATTITDCTVGGTGTDAVTVTTAGSIKTGGTGGLVGAGTATVTFSGSHFNGSVTGVALVGGLTGQISAKTTYDDCSSAGSVEATGSIADFVSNETASYAGGIAGAAKYSDVLTSCSSTADVTANQGIVGGLIGDAAGVTLGKSEDATKACHYRNGTVTASGGTDRMNSAVGGMIGIARSTAVKIYYGAIEGATVTGLRSVGGALGFNQVATASLNNITASNVTVSGSVENIGGLVGYLNYGAVLTSCKLEGTSKVEGPTVVGGILGLNNTGGGVINSCSTGDKTEIIGTGISVGGIVGSCTSKVVIDKANSASTITGAQRVGGIVGNLNAGSSTITACVVSGKIISTNAGNSDAGGIIGMGDSSSSNLTISNCESSADITSKGQQIGGIVGRAIGSNFLIELCKSSGVIASEFNGANSYSAGIIGYINNAGTIKKCFSDATVKGSMRCGGIAGIANGTGVKNIEECSFEGSVVGGQDVGGILALAFAGTINVLNCYSAGILSSLSPYYGNASGSAGGVVGTCSSASTQLVISNCYSKMSITAGTSGSAGVGGIFGSRTNGSISMSDCLAWNELLDFSNVAGTDELNGAISELNSGITLSNNYRTTGLVMGTTYKLNGTRALVDDAAGRDGMPYSGTCSAKASELGWDTEVWDLTSGDYPVLINVAK